MQLAESNKEIAQTMKEMRSDFQQSYTENARVQTAILTGLEVLRDRDQEPVGHAYASLATNWAIPHQG